MSNPITLGIAAVISHINKHTAVPEEVTKAAISLRKELNKLSKDELVERIINMQLKQTVKVVQGDLIADILCDEACQALTYEEISETILENMETDQKYSVDNLRWYKSNLQNVKGLPVLNRLPAAERKAIERQLLKDAMKK